jgi:hypothetical protein
MKFVEEVRGYSEITNRRPTPRPAVLYLMELRSQEAEVAAPKRKVAIFVGLEKTPEIAHPVKINFIKPRSAALPVVIR